jgi:hypothetical protein
MGRVILLRGPGKVSAWNGDCKATVKERARSAKLARFKGKQDDMQKNPFDR